MLKGRKLFCVAVGGPIVPSLWYYGSIYLVCIDVMQIVGTTKPAGVPARFS